MILLLKCPICNHLTMYHDGAGCKISSCDCKKKGKEFRGAGDSPWDTILTSPTFRPISNITDWLVRFNKVLIILTLISSATTFFLTFFDTNSRALSDNIYSVIGVPFLIIGIPEFILFILWYFRATKNIHAFGARSVTSPIMAVIWWFVPIANLWKPYYVTQQIWKASNPEVKLTEGIEWKKSPSSKTIKQWWALYLISIAGAVFVAVIGSTNFDTENYMQTEEVGQPAGSIFDLLAIPIQVMGIISIFLFIRILRQISNRQYLKLSDKERLHEKQSKKLLIIFIIAIVTSIVFAFLTYVNMPDLILVNKQVTDLNIKGNELYTLGQYQEAITWYDKALALDSNDIDTLKNKGDSLYALGRYQEAITWYDKALALDSSYVDVLYYKGNSLYALGQYQEAITWYDEALSIEPDNGDILKYKNAALNELK